MAIKLDIIQNGAIKSVSIASPSVMTVINNSGSASPKAVVNTLPTATVVNVLKGQPGLQNVHVGPTPPANPFENMIWIDTSGG